MQDPKIMKIWEHGLQKGRTCICGKLERIFHDPAGTVLLTSYNKVLLLTSEELSE
jgi:hypothetical protein